MIDLWKVNKYALKLKTKKVNNDKHIKHRHIKLRNKPVIQSDTESAAGRANPARTERRPGDGDEGALGSSFSSCSSWQLATKAKISISGHN